MKIAQIADDTTLFLSDFASVGNVLQIVEQFHIISGLKLNVNKSIAKCIGSLAQNECNNMYDLVWTDGPIRTLGITISNDPQVLMNENFMPRLKIMNNILHMWLCRGLSLKGKVTILKSLALPILYYPMSVLPIPTEVVEIAENMIFDFIWSQRRPKIKKDVIIQDIHNGGIKVPSFKVMVEANRISWISRLLSN